MWHDTWSPWLMLSIIAYGVILFFAVTGGISAYYNARSGKVPKGLITGSLIITILGGLFNGFTYKVSENSPTVSAVPDLTESFGFKSGQTYSLIAGARFGGSVVNAHGGRWSFTITSIPASAISVSFAGADNKFYIIDIPLNKITFTQREDVEPTMTLNLKTDDINAAFSSIEVGKSTPCRKGFEALMLACHSDATATRIPAAGAMEAGLSPLVMDYLQNAQMTVTPKMYDKILGKDG